MQLLEKNRIVKILASIVTMMLVLIQMIKIPDHTLIYNFFTWLTWPALFFITGYYIKEKETFTNIFNTLKYYLLPYILIGGIVIILNKLTQFFQLTKWINTIFPSIKKGALTLAYGNGTATNTLLGDIDFGVGLLWVLLALCFGTIIQIMIIKFKMKSLRVLISFGLMILGFYIGTIVQLPWSLNAALVMQPYLLLGYFFRESNNAYKIKNINAPATVGVGVLAVWTMAISNGAFNLTLASIRYWILGTVTAMIGLLMLMLIVVFIEKILPAGWYKWFIRIGTHQSISIALLAFFSLMIPIYNYVNMWVTIPYISFIMVWSVVLIIVVGTKGIIENVIQRYLKNYIKEG